MKLLALDTSSPACSVALQMDGNIYERHAEREREHTRLLLPMIRTLLEEASLEVSQLDAIALGNGPGSFIGMRIAASVAQGLAHAAGIKIVPVSSLACIADEVFANFDAAQVIVAQDAHMHEVYLGGFGRGAGGQPVELFDTRLQQQQPIAELGLPAAGVRLAAGAGWDRYPGLLAANRQYIDQLVDVRYPRARHLLGLAAQALRNGLAVPPADIEPFYLRHTVAQQPASRS